MQDPFQLVSPDCGTAKPFVKWVGGKGQLISQLVDLLPTDFAQWQDVTYIEPFVGGGAFFFHMLRHYGNITRAVINDVNPDLIKCYSVVKEQPDKLIQALEEIQAEYYALPDEPKRQQFFLEKRAEFNTKSLSLLDNSKLFIFLNRTCFNGLYRVNKKGLFNVPFGKYVKPTICDKETIMADSRLLQRVEILNGDYSATLDKAEGKTLFYFDPPYRPLSSTSSFNDYTKDSFNDDEQRRLKEFCDRIHAAGHFFMLSNSDCFAKDGKDRFFDDLYAAYTIERVWASRSVNANPAKRGKLTEILVRNFGEKEKILVAAEPD